MEDFGIMTDKEMKDLFRDIAVEYPNFIRNENDRATNDKINLYLKELEQFSCEDVSNGFRTYLNSDRYCYPPHLKDLKDFAKMEQNKSKTKSRCNKRRIITAEEDCANEYKELMSKNKNPTGERKEYCKKLAPFYLLFNGNGWEERYEKYFGKPREEFEKLD